MIKDIDSLTGWIGRTETVEDLIAPGPLAGYAATLDRDDPPPKIGDALPPSAHWLYFLPRHPQSELAKDGHAEKGGFLPPVALPRRMWAGGRLEFKAPLRVGDQATRLSEIRDVSVKKGRSGQLAFVVVRHTVSGPNGVAIIEEHDIVYREAAKPGTPEPPPEPAPAEAVWHRPIMPDPVLLFRYSALTFNGHRIHYDREYCIKEEKYPGLIVHGPLMATQLMDLCRREMPTRPLKKFRFRAVRPVFDIHPYSINGALQAGGKAATLWVLDHQGALAMRATADFGD